MLITVSLFVVGLALLLVGGETLVRGAAAIARSLGVPPVAIGLTVVAFGTSAPEFFVAVTAALTGAVDVSYGNLVGANIVNVALILGITAVLIPLTVHPTVVTREIPMLVLALCATLILSSDTLLGAGPDRLERGDGMILWLLFGVFLYYTVLSLKRSPPDEFVAEARAVGWRQRTRTILTPIALTMFGLVALGLGGGFLVDSAVKIANSLGMTQAAIGLTIVSVGTTLPELTTSLLAARKGDADLAVGNVVGSGIFNILFILGTAATITPIDIPARGPVAVAIAIVLTASLLLMIYTRQRRIARIEGALLLAVFIGYMSWVALLS